VDVVIVLCGKIGRKARHASRRLEQYIPERFRLIADWFEDNFDACPFRQGVGLVKHDRSIRDGSFKRHGISPLARGLAVTRILPDERSAALEGG
jgi:hypothetical protein